MASTTGFVQKIIETEGIAATCVWIGASPTSAEIFFIILDTDDSDRVKVFKQSMIHLFTMAFGKGYPVRVIHPGNSAEVEGVSIDGFDISPIGRAIHNDFYTISGSNIPDDVEIVFDSDLMTVTVTPDVVRPHLVFVAELPPQIPLGRNTVQLQAPGGWSSDAVPIDVLDGPQATVRVLYSGQPKDRPYNIVFVANPAIESTTGGTFTADPVLTNRPGYHDVVAYCLQNMFTEAEDFLRRNNIDAQMRLMTVFDSTLTTNDANALARAIDPNLMATRRQKLRSFLSRYSEIADLVVVLHGSTAFNRATAYLTTDDNGLGTVPFTYDGVDHNHGRFPDIPGSTAIPIDTNQAGMTALHEIGHAASDFNNGGVRDLYSDASTGFNVNKKMRDDAADPIPIDFATYNGANYLSDQNRDGIGYPDTWISYHPELIDNTRPNLMDNYWFAADPTQCRLDQLSYDWYRDRLNAKLSR